MRLLKCYGEDCIKNNIKHPKEELIEDGSKRYCKKCLEKKRKKIEERDNLYHLIEEMFDIPFPTGRMLREIRQFEEERNYTIDGMYKTLLYLKTQTSIKLNKNYGVGIIAYYYDKAIEFFEKREKQLLKDTTKNIEKTIVQTKKPSNENRILKEKIIDLEDLI